MKLRYARPEKTAFPIIVGEFKLIIPPSGIVEVSDENGERILAKSQSFAVLSDAPPPKAEVKVEPAREDLGPLVRVQVAPAHASPAGYLIEGKIYRHDPKGVVEVPEKIAARWIEQKRAKPVPAAPPGVASEPAKSEPAKSEATDTKSDDKPRGRRGQRAEEPTASQAELVTEPAKSEPAKTEAQAEPAKA